MKLLIRYTSRALAGLLVLLLIMQGSAFSTERKEQVVLLHGIARSSSHMDDLEKFLEAKGYSVINMDYPSTEHTIEQLAAIVADNLADTMKADQPVHFVGYSMGGIVTRAVLNKYRPDNLGRVVQLASPNGGSEVADFLKGNFLYEKFYGPAGSQLTTVNAGIDNLMGEVDYELGVLAGTFTIDPVSSSLIPGDDDGKVSVESTKVDGMKEHRLVNASHTFFPQNSEVLELTARFLEAGSFRR